MKNNILLATGLILLNWNLASGQHVKDELSFLFYNVENLFHPSDDSASFDDDFTPGGIRGWSYARYQGKISAICKVMLSCKPWDYPDIVCLCEIENRQILENIIHHPILIHCDYGIVHRDSKDHRGMDCALLYRKDRLRLIDQKWIAISDPEGRIQQTRDILCAIFASRKDTLAVYSNHWTSKYGGELATEGKRIRQSEILGRHIDSLLECHPNYLMIIGGDFNDNSSSKSINRLMEIAQLSEVLPSGLPGTYKYQGKWDAIDHVFTGNNRSFSHCSALIINNPYLLENDELYMGLKPFRTYSGFRYNGGISDHLPIYLEIGL